MVEEQKRRIVFMGTPEFAAIILKKIIDCGQYEICAVFTRPDKKSGRGMKMVYSEVKKLALQYNLPLYQFASLKTSDAENTLRQLSPDFIVVAAYGLILPQAILDMVKLEVLNVHASLLPAYRGAAPIQRAIMENWQPDAKTGVSIMKVVQALDAGPVYATAEIPIGHKDAKTLELELADLGADALLKVISGIDRDGITPKDQDGQKATYAAKLEKSDGHIDWTRSAAEIDARIRAVTPWPGARCVFTFTDGGRDLNVAILPGKIGDPVENASCGDIWRDKNGLRIASSDCWYELDLLRPEGKKEMSGADFANGQSRTRSGFCGRASACKCI